MSKKVETNVQTLDVDMDELLGVPGADDVILSAEEKKEPKKTVFSSGVPDTTFLDKFEKDDDPKPDPEPGDDPDPESGDDPDPDPEPKDDPEPFNPGEPGELENDDPEPADKNKGGRPTVMVSVLKKMIDKGTILPFDDDKKLEDYTEEDFTDLLNMNIDQIKDQLLEDMPKQFFGNMPVEMQKAYTYIANGGTDLKGFFGQLAIADEIQSLDVADERGQKEIIRTYLHNTSWGTPEEIEEEIYSLEDKNELEKKAKQFKPKLDAMQEQIVNKKLQDQQQAKQQMLEQSQNYVNSVYSVLEKGELNGVKLDNKTQNMLYAGLVQSNHVSKRTGRQTNMFGYLLEKYQWEEPRHDLIAEALWLLADPDGYKNSLANNVEQKTNQKTLRTLKTEEGNKSRGSNELENESKSSISRKRPGLPRPQKNFFQR